MADTLREIYGLGVKKGPIPRGSRPRRPKKQQRPPNPYDYESRPARSGNRNINKQLERLRREGLI